MNFLRTIVSQGRNRFVQDGFDLDLTYVTPQVIAMGLPSAGVESAYRNHQDEVSRFLDKFHHDRFMIWNTSERLYSYDKFQQQVLEFGWPDHHAPPLGVLFQICQSMDSWLKADPLNVAVVHCKAGKGRTGTVVAAYLLYSGMCSTANEAIEYFKRKRGGGGIKQGSQKRYVAYFDKILRGFRPPSRPLLLRKLVFNGVPVCASMPTMGFRPAVELLHENTTLLYSSRTGDSDLHEDEDEDGVLVSQPSHTFCPSQPGMAVVPVNGSKGVRVVGDVLLRCFHLKSGAPDSRCESLFRVSFHTGFVRDGVLRLPLDRLDAVTRRRFPAKDFSLDLIFCEAGDADEVTSWPWEFILERRQHGFGRARVVSSGDRAAPEALGMDDDDEKTPPSPTHLIPMSHSDPSSSAMTHTSNEEHSTQDVSESPSLSTSSDD